MVKIYAQETLEEEQGRALAKVLRLELEPDQVEEVTVGRESELELVHPKFELPKTACHKLVLEYRQREANTEFDHVLCRHHLSLAKSLKNYTN